MTSVERASMVNDIAALVTEPKIIYVTHGGKSVPILVRPNHTVNGIGWQADYIKDQLDKWLDAPERITGNASAFTLQSFIDLTNRHKSKDSAIFADMTTQSPCFKTIVNYHGVDDHKPAFGDHQIAYSYPISEEWLAWRSQNGSAMMQADWGFFIEEHVADFASPTQSEKDEFQSLFRTEIAEPTRLVELGRGLSISVDARVTEVRNLQSGEGEISYEETHTGKGGEKLTIPGLFIINIPFFVDGERTRMLARLRYRKVENRIKWFYQLYRPDLRIRERLAADLKSIADKTGLPTFEGRLE